MKSLSLHKPHLLIVVGIPGSGKSFFAQQFADTFNAPFIHYGVLQNAMGHPISPEDTATFAGVLFEELVKTRQSILIEGPGSNRAERQMIAQQAISVGYEPLIIWVQTEPVTAQARALKTGLTPAQFEDEVRHFQPLNDSEASIVISGKHTYASQARIVLKRLIKPERRATPPPVVPQRPGTSKRRIGVQ